MTPTVGPGGEVLPNAWLPKGKRGLTPRRPGPMPLEFSRMAVVTVQGHTGYSKRAAEDMSPGQAAQQSWVRR